MPSEEADLFRKKLVSVMRDERQRIKMSHEAWAIASGVNRAAISRWESEARVPSIMALYDLATALGSPLHVFCEEAQKRSIS